MKDASGRSATAKTAADGAFSIVSTGLTPPYLLQVPGPDGTLYSVSADGQATTTINVTTLTDLATRAWFTINGSNSMDAVFANPAGIARPTPSQIKDAEELIDGVFTLWFKDAGVDATTHNLFSTPFKADGTGVDKVLGLTSVNGWEITITGSVTPAAAAKASAARRAPSPAAVVQRTQVSEISFDAAGKTATVESTVTAGTETTVSAETTVLSTSATMESAFQEIDAIFKALAKVASDKRQALVAADVLPYLDPQHMNQGLNPQEMADLFVAQVKLSTADTFGGYLISLDELDLANGTAHGYYTFTEVKGGQTAVNKQESRFRKVDGKWLFSGDGRPCYMYLKFATYTAEDDLSWNSIQANCSTREGAYVSATVSGGQWVDVAMNPDDSTTVDEAGHRFRGFWLESSDTVFNDLPPAGTPFTFKLQPANSGPQEEYQVRMNAATSAQVWITSAPTGTAANLAGTRVTLTWTLPVTVLIEEVNLQGVASAGPPEDEVSCDMWGDALGTNATSGSIDILADCDGQPITHFYLEVNVEGARDEEISAFRNYF